MSRVLHDYSPPIPASIQVFLPSSSHLLAALSNLNASSPTYETVVRALDVIQSEASSSNLASSSSRSAGEDAKLQHAVVTKAALVVYSQLVEQLLREAVEADNEAEWWQRIETSRWSLAYFLLQTVPSRISHAFNEVLTVFRRNNLQLSVVNFRTEAFRQQIAPNLQLFTSLFPSFAKHPELIGSRLSPFALVRHECHDHRKTLADTRNSRAEQLGKLAFVGAQFVEFLQAGHQSQPGDTTSYSKHATPNIPPSEVSEWFITELQRLIAPPDSPPVSLDAPDPSSLSSVLRDFIKKVIPTHQELHTRQILPHRRPHRLTLLWPKLIFLPPAILIGVRAAYKNRDSIANNIRDLAATTRSFWEQWVLEPAADILRTIRSGGDESARVISKDGLKSDMESLERMVLALATEKENWPQDRLGELTEQIHKGDLTSVLKIYEDDIKTPVRSAITGTLVRSLLIQVQKAKVDIDLALAGIDKLLRSQELTFGFVGVAPSLAIIYVTGGWVRNLWSGGKGKYGGKRGREDSFYAMRRIERLLNNASPSSEPLPAPPSLRSTTSSPPPTKWQIPLSPLTQGLLLISLSHLRSYAENQLPKHSKLKEGFLEDLTDLEDPNLGKEEKLRVVRRMWRSWGSVLGWGRVAGGEKMKVR